jgi:hypothetical protein
MFELNTLGAQRRKVAAERLKICEECPELDPVLYQCQQCGCFMKAKTMFMDSKCPLDKWGKHKETTDGVSIS